MKVVVKSALYIILALLSVYFFRQFRTEYNEAFALGSVLPMEPLETNAVVAAASTNSEPTGTNLITTNLVSESTNNLGHATNGLAVTNANSTKRLETTQTVTPDRVGRHRSAAMLYMSLFVLTIIFLGGLASWDFARSAGERSHSLVFQENEGVERSPEYEAAEQEWSNGNYLEAVTQMREYLRHHPSEQYVALRIAEIYEKDLNNHVAAAMELEEVLTKRLPREKWGWTAIHLANIYSGRLNKPDQAISLLNRIVEHYPETGAAKKARSRLGLPEPESSVSADTSESNEERLGAQITPPEDQSNLPKGFRPKK